LTTKSCPATINIISVGAEMFCFWSNSRLLFIAAALLISVSSASAGEPKSTEVLPAGITSLGLPSLGLPLKSKIVSISDSLVAAKVVNGVLNLQVLDDPGEDTIVTVVLAAPGGDQTTLTVKVISLFHTTIRADGEGNPPALLVEGLGPQNTLRSSGLTLTPNTNAKIVPEYSNISAVSHTGAAFDLTPRVRFRKTDNSIVITRLAMQEIFMDLPSGLFDISINLGLAKTPFAANYAFRALIPQATINGTLVNSIGQPVTTLRRPYIAAVGAHSGLRKVTRLRADGTFKFSELVSDSYRLELLDLQAPGLTSSTAVVFSLDTEVQATLEYVDPNFLAEAAKANKGKPATRNLRGGTFKGNGPVPARRELERRSPAPPVREASSESCIATSGQQGATEACQFVLEVPQGTSTVGVRITVESAEYPYWTTQHSQYDDTWSYLVSGLPGVAYQAAGHVNSSHYTTGTVTADGCHNVAASTKNGPVTITAMGRATNVGDSALATSVSIEVVVGCADLNVSSAVFGSLAKNGYQVLWSNPGHGGFISIPRKNVPSNWGVPLTVHFTPESAKITGAKLSLFHQGNIVAQRTIPLPATIGKGVVEFQDMIMPSFPMDATSDLVSFNIQLQGVVGGQPASSDGEFPNISRQNQYAFQPLFLAGLGTDEGDLSGTTHRYGCHTPVTGVPECASNAGFDSWSQAYLIDWLRSSNLNGAPFRFDDTSALHAARKPNGRSALDHATHYVGMSADLRYADGQGGFSDQLGGAGNGQHILQMLKDAQQEVVDNTQQKPNLTALKNWLTANRGLFDNVTSDDRVRQVYVGPGWMMDMLVKGQFPNKQAIPGAGAWPKPAILSPAAKHESHWHVDLVTPFSCPTCV
jgi:hypothetical protein